ncbi:MAG: HpsJ family protein [Halothece sp.]
MSNRRRRPFWKKLRPPELPPLQVPRPLSRLPRKLRKLQFPGFGPFRLPRKLRKLRPPEPPPLQLPRFSIPNPFSQVFIREGETRNYLFILNWLGYVLLFVSAIDYFVLFYPPQLTNPNWEFQTVRGMVSNAWFVLLALILIYIPNRTQIRRFELAFLKFLRWIVLVGGIVFILLIPLTLNNAQRIHQNTVAQINQQQTQRQEQLNNLEQAVKTQEIPPEERQRLGDALGINVTPNSENIRKALLEEINQQKQQLKQQVAAQKNNSYQELLRQATRTSVAIFLIGIFLIRLWWETRWLKSIRRGKTSYYQSFQKGYPKR